MKYNWKLIFVGLLFLVLVSAVFAGYLARDNVDKCIGLCEDVTYGSTLWDAATWAVQSETALSIQSTEYWVAQTKTPPAETPSPTASPTPSPIATP